jgi:histidyl-tRNA synthetase
MRELGFTKEDFRIRLSDRNAWVEFASRSGVAEGSLSTFLQIIDKIGRTPEDKTNEQLAALGLSLDAIKAFMQSGPEASDSLAEILVNLEFRGLSEYVEVDLSIVRGLAYYTGPVFEIFDIGKGMRAVAGGGRYDQLVQLIGSVDMPACGFAMGDMVITDLIRETEVPAQKLEAAVMERSSIDFYLIVADSERAGEAVGVAQLLRGAGYRVTFPFTPMKVGKQFQAAEQSGAKRAVVVGSEYPQLSIKNLEERSESISSLDSLLSDVSE